MTINCIITFVDGHCPVMVPALNAYLTDKLPAFVTVVDSSLEVIALLRILHAFNNYWSTMYEVRSILHAFNNYWSTMYEVR